VLDLVNVPKTVRINEAWEVGYNQIVDFSPYLEGTRDSVSVLDFPVQNSGAPTNYKYCWSRTDIWTYFQNIYIKQFSPSEYFEADSEPNQLNLKIKTPVSTILSSVFDLRTWYSTNGTWSMFMYVYVLDV